MQGHVRQRKNRDGTPGSWQVIVYLGKDPITGKPRTKAGSAPTKRAAMALRNQLIAEAGDGNGTEHLGTTATVAEMFESYITLGGPPGENSRYNYTLAWRKHLKPHIGALAARDLRGRHLNDCYAAMAKAGSKPATIRGAHKVASGMCTFGMKNDWLVHNPARNASPPATPQTAVRATPDVDIVALLTELQGHIFGLCVLVSATLGTRRGETLGLQWGDVDFANAQITVRRRVVVNPGKGLAVLDFTKTGRNRTIAIPDATLAALANRHVEAQAIAALAEGELTPQAFIFTNSPNGHRPWYPASATRNMKLVRRRLGLTDAHLHGLRHAVATRLIAAGVDARTVSERLGNSPDVVLRVYSHFVPAADRAAAAILGEALNPSPRR